MQDGSALVMLLAKVTVQVLPLSITISGTRALSLPCSTTPATCHPCEPTPTSHVAQLTASAAVGASDFARDFARVRLHSPKVTEVLDLAPSTSVAVESVTVMEPPVKF